MSSDTRSFFDLKSNFIFYASYHNNPVNVGIHLFCIWNLVWSFFALEHYVPPLMDQPAILSNIPLLGGVPLGLATLSTLVYAVSYVLMEPVIGGLGAILMLVVNNWSYKLVTSYSGTVLGLPLWQAILGFHLLMWIIQFIGHGVFEKRAPALLESWDQALITAPLFVLLEVAFFFGYRPEFYQECMREVEQNLENISQSKNE